MLLSGGEVKEFALWENVLLFGGLGVIGLDVGSSEKGLVYSLLLKALYQIL